MMRKDLDDVFEEEELISFFSELIGEVDFFLNDNLGFERLMFLMFGWIDFIKMKLYFI